MRLMVLSCLRKSSRVNWFLRSFSSSCLGLVLVDGLLGLLDERQHVAHAEHARDDAIGMEELEVVDGLRRCR